jgi:DNA-binding transcriptional MerR regulator
MPENKLLTIRDVARECGVRVHRAKYAIAENGIEPHQRAGNMRLFSPQQIPVIKSALSRIENHREVLSA